MTATSVLFSSAGYPEDVAKVGRRELQTFFEQHYGPTALTIAIVGDVTVEQVSVPAWRSSPAP